VAVDGAGNVVVADSGNPRVAVYSAVGQSGETGGRRGGSVSLVWGRREVVCPWFYGYLAVRNFGFTVLWLVRYLGVRIPGCTVPLDLRILSAARIFRFFSDVCCG
jgi:hypothetical protein